MRRTPEDDKIRENVAVGFLAMLDRIDRHPGMLREDTRHAVNAAYETWRAGQCDLAISVLIDILIRLFDDRINRQPNA